MLSIYPNQEIPDAEMVDDDEDYFGIKRLKFRSFFKRRQIDL